MRLIVISGPEASGKTHILKSLAERMSSFGAIVSVNKDFNNHPHYDKVFCVAFKQYNIVIYTMGDNNNDIQKACLEDPNADCVICATRHQFRTTYQQCVTIDKMATIIMIDEIDKNNMILRQREIVEYLFDLVKCRLEHPIL